jgi:nucleoside-diphosphate-sugar epimerase
MSHIDGAPSNVYGSVKKATRMISHSLAKQQDVDFISVALANTFGPGDYSNRSTNIIIRNLLNNESILLTKGNHLYDWIYIEDTVDGIISALMHGRSDELYYIGDNLKPLKNIIYQVRDHISPKVEIILGAYKENFHVDYSSVDTKKLYKDTAFKPKTDFIFALDETVNWIKNIHDIKNVKED